MPKKALRRRVLRGLNNALLSTGETTTRHYSIFSPEEMAYIERRLLSDTDERTDHPVSTSSPRESTVTNNVVARQEVKRDPVLSDIEDLTDEEKAHLKQLERDELYGNIADDLREFRTTLGLTTATPLTFYAGIPITMANALIDNYWFHDPKYATRELQDLVIATGLSKLPAAAKAIAKTKYVAPVVSYLNKKAVAPISQWWTTKVSPIMARAATTAKRLLPSWTDRTPTLTEKLAAEGKELLANHPEVHYSLIKPLRTPYGTVIYPVKQEITSENSQAFRDAVHGVRDATEHWNSSEADALELRLEEEAKKLGLTYTNPVKLNKSIKSIGLYEDPQILGTGVGGVAVRDPLTPLDTDIGFFDTDFFKARPYGMGFHEGTHGNLVGMEIVGNDVATKLNTLLYSKKIIEALPKLLDKSTMQTISRVFPEEASLLESMLRNSAEYIAYMALAGKELGVKEFAPYPGDGAMMHFLQENLGKNKVLNAVMLLSDNTTKSLKAIWDSLAGNYIMGTAGVVGGGAALYNTFNDNNNDLDIY